METFRAANLQCCYRAATVAAQATELPRGGNTGAADTDTGTDTDTSVRGRLAIASCYCNATAATHNDSTDVERTKHRNLREYTAPTVRLED